MKYISIAYTAQNSANEMNKLQIQPKIGVRIRIFNLSRKKQYNFL